MSKMPDSPLRSRTKKASAPALSLGPWWALVVLSTQTCCNFTVAVPLLGFTESPNSIASTGRQTPSRQLHEIWEGNLPIGSPWDARLDTQQNQWHSHSPGYSRQKTAHYPRSTIDKEDLARKQQSTWWSWLGCKVSLMMGCVGNCGL